MVVVAEVDWSRARWREAELSGAVLAQVAVPKALAPAVVGAERAVLDQGLEEDRAEVVEHWRGHSTWRRPPLLVTGDVTGTYVSYELIVGATRLGRLRGLIGRGEMPAERRHRVWIGQT